MISEDVELEDTENAFPPLWTVEFLTLLKALSTSAATSIPILSDAVTGPLKSQLLARLGVICLMCSAPGTNSVEQAVSVTPATRKIAVRIKNFFQ